ncbi:hypothetical protein MA03_04815 [Infirmifilum uzonense]|uniref:Uncharacterized protein n=1 Tax=Infirmifilum uzonense TaxID=1550241 RepID=A0A0F7CL37_9CREN|nr:hypothetical protein MA03_04815 [Infirmifilum uzonense]
MKNFSGETQLPCATESGSRVTPMRGYCFIPFASVGHILPFFPVRAYAEILPDQRSALDSIDAMLRELEELSARIDGLLEE